MLNHIVVMGRLVRDPELRRTQSGTAVTSFTIAVDRDFQTKGEEKQTDFIDCVAWRSTAEFIAKYFLKGSMAIVSGKLQIREWTDKEGNKRRNAEVVADNVYFGESKRNDTTNGTNKPVNVEFSGDNGPLDELQAKFPNVVNTDFEEITDDGDDLPF